MNMTTFGAADASTPLSEQGLRNLRRDVLVGTLEAGSKLKLDELQSHYGFASSPLREELSCLTQEGLVRADERRGFRVSPISSDGSTALPQYAGESLSPIVRLVRSPLIVEVYTPGGIKSTEELLARARADTKKVFHASSSADALGRFAVGSASAIKMTHVPFNSGALPVQAVPSASASEFARWAQADGERQKALTEQAGAVIQ